MTIMSGSYSYIFFCSNVPTHKLFRTVQLNFCLACKVHVGATMLLGLQHFIWKPARLDSLLQFYFKMGQARGEESLEGLFLAAN